MIENEKKKLNISDRDSSYTLKDCILSNNGNCAKYNVPCGGTTKDTDICPEWSIANLGVIFDQFAPALESIAEALADSVKAKKRI